MVTQPGVSLAAYDRIRPGMSYEDVGSLIGQGTEINRTARGDITMVMYEWRLPGGANVNVVFENSRLIQKAQFGLR